MTRLEDYTNGLRSVFVEHAADVVTLQNAIPEIRYLPPSLVERMYADYSDTLAAGWLVVDDSNITNFRDWILT